jgi:TolB-like protein/Tfp pilus assembly protein PilF/tRNA A-37 threonylcarbamoyl transferase component Bud32
MTLKCPKCHTNNPDDSSYCGNCATRLIELEDISALPTKTIDTPTEKLTRGTTFADRYEIIEELGEGGMGKVYRVEDNKIKEEVALKLLRPQIAVDKKTIERFRNELKFARKIAHKNVLRMYHLGEEEGTYYITMEYMPGEDLRSMIKMSKQLSTGTAINIAKQVCEGLSEAHRLEVVHRDLKPSNVMIDRDGNARIMDFGIARSLKARGLTGAGALIGTPEYMSPEQVEGKEADPRSDIYSLGVMLYEMIIGRMPFEGDTPLSIAMKHKTEAPPDPRDFNAQIPEGLSYVILKCLEKDKEKRYQDTKELLSELRRIEEEISTTEGVVLKRKTTTLKEMKVTLRKRWTIISALFMVVVIAIAAILYFSKGQPVSPPREKMLVVLPFNNLGPPEDEYFADGIAEEITSRLAALHGLGIISRTSAIQYKETNKTIKQIGEELGVDYVLEGTVRWDRSTEGKGRVRITSQLIRVTDDTHLWTDSYDRVIEDIFSVQSEIAEEVARQLDLTILEPERRALNRRPTENLDAYDYYLQGRKQEYRGWSHGDSKEFERALELLEKAVELDPEFVHAYISLSMNHSWMYFAGWDRTEERLEKSKAALDRALELQPNLSDAQLALGFYYYRGLLDYERASEIFESIQKARPNISTSLLGYIQRRQGKWEESLENLKKAFKLNPRSIDVPVQMGLSYFIMRRYEEADEWFDRTLSIDPNSIPPKFSKVESILFAKGNTEEARAMLEKLPQTQMAASLSFNIAMFDRNYQEALDLIKSISYDSGFPYMKDIVCASLYRAKKEWALMKSHAESARVILEKLVNERPNDPRFHASLGLAYAYLGRKEEAIAEGNRAVSLYPVSKDAVGAPRYVYNLALIYTFVGQYEDAISQLEYLLSIPAGDLISVPILRIDPDWDPLRSHPGFQRLLEKHSVDDSLPL